MNDQAEMATAEVPRKPLRTPVSNFVWLLVMAAVLWSYRGLLTRGVFSWKAFLMSLLLCLASVWNFRSTYRGASERHPLCRYIAWLFVLYALCWAVEEWHSNLRFLFH